MVSAIICCRHRYFFKEKIMERKRSHHRFHPRFKQRKFYQEKSEVRKKVEDLMERYPNMSEGTALQIAMGVLSLEGWEAQEQEQQNLQQKWCEIEEQFSQFSNSAKLHLQTAVSVLKGAFGLKEYREQKIIKMEIHSRAEELANHEKIPIHIAKMILLGKFTLEEYQARQALKQQRCEQAEQLHCQHPEIALGTCYAICDQGMSVDEYLERREMNQAKRKKWYREYLVQHSNDNQPLAQYLQRLRNRRVLLFVSLCNSKSLVGTVIGHTPYEIKFRTQQEQVLMIPKIDIKYFCRINYAEQVLALIKFVDIQQPPDLLSNNIPKTRYEIPNEFLEEGNNIQITLTEGEMFIGKIQWFSRYDIKIMLSFSPKASILIFRHAIVSAQLVSNK